MPTQRIDFKALRASLDFARVLAHYHVDGKQKGDELGESQIALASEILRLTPSRIKESGALNKGREPG